MSGLDDSASLLVLGDLLQEQGLTPAMKTEEVLQYLHHPGVTGALARAAWEETPPQERAAIWLCELLNQLQLPCRREGLRVIPVLHIPHVTFADPEEIPYPSLTREGRLQLIYPFGCSGMRFSTYWGSFELIPWMVPRECYASFQRRERELTRGVEAGSVVPVGMPLPAMRVESVNEATPTRILVEIAARLWNEMLDFSEPHRPQRVDPALWQQLDELSTQLIEQLVLPPDQPIDGDSLLRRALLRGWTDRPNQVLAAIAGDIAARGAPAAEELRTFECLLPGPWRAAEGLSDSPLQVCGILYGTAPTFPAIDPPVDGFGTGNYAGPGRALWENLPTLERRWPRLRELWVDRTEVLWEDAGDDGYWRWIAFRLGGAHCS